MKKIAKSITDLIGNTPLIELNNYSKQEKLKTVLIAKLESFNPMSSVKDRVGYALIKNAEDNNLINKDTVLIEATSGNTGISLAYIGASKGYKVILTMPDTMSIERQTLLKAFGAKVILTKGSEGMKGAIAKAKEIKKNTPNSYIPNQFTNQANPNIHRNTTAIEIWNDTSGEIDILIAGVGTGGTITGIGEFLKKKNKNIRIIAVEPFDSPILSKGKAGPHKIQGIGAGFVPEILNTNIIDDILLVKNDEAYKTSRLLAKSEGLLVGISSGAALYAATKLARLDINKNKKIIVILPDSGERYLSTNLFI